MVQALKYENFQTINEAYKKEKEEAIIKNLESSTPERYLIAKKKYFGLYLFKYSLGNLVNQVNCILMK